jgi:hypothetical protein
VADGMVDRGIRPMTNDAALSLYFVAVTKSRTELRKGNPAQAANAVPHMRDAAVALKQRGAFFARLGMRFESAAEDLQKELNR